MNTRLLKDQHQQKQQRYKRPKATIKIYANDAPLKLRPLKFIAFLQFIQIWAVYSQYCCCVCNWSGGDFSFCGRPFACRGGRGPCCRGGLGVARPCVVRLSCSGCSCCQSAQQQSESHVSSFPNVRFAWERCSSSSIWPRRCRPSVWQSGVEDNVEVNLVHDVFCHGGVGHASGGWTGSGPQVSIKVSGDEDVSPISTAGFRTLTFFILLTCTIGFLGLCPGSAADP